MAEPKAAKPPGWLRRLGNRIRQVRRLRGLTQTDLARPNLTKSFISLLESGRTYPSVGTLVMLADRLQTSLALLLLDDSELPREITLTLLHLARTTGGRGVDSVDAVLSAAAALAERADDLQAEIMLTRSDIAASQGRTVEAGKLLTEALAWVRKRKLRPYEPRIIARLASYAQQGNDPEIARARLEEALNQFRATRTLRSVDGCDAMLTYAAILLDGGKPVRALRVFQDVARVAERQDLPVIRGRAYIGMARAHLLAGRAQETADALRHAKSALEGITDFPDLSRTLRALADLQAAAGHPHDAQTSLQQALRLSEQFPDARLRAALLADLANVSAHLGRYDDAASAAKNALDLLRAHPDAHQRGRLLLTLARVARSQKRSKQAIEQFRDAIALFKKGRHQAELAESARELGMYLKEHGEHAEAAEYLAMAITAEKTRSR